MFVKRSFTFILCILLTAIAVLAGCSATVRDAAPSAEECAHSYGEWQTVTEADCLGEGRRMRVCTLCRQAEEERIPAAGHRIAVLEETPPDCVNGGRTGGEYCTVCGRVLKEQTVMPARGHGPFEVRGAVKETETENGYTGDTYCLTCGMPVMTGQTVPATGHRNPVLVGAVDASCEEEGYSGDWYCPECDAIVAYGAKLPPRGHTYTEVMKTAPDCAHGGYTLERCQSCGSERKTGFLDPVGHAPDDGGRCIYCGTVLYDRSGDFGSRFFDRFLNAGSAAVTLEGDAGIRDYARAEGLPLADKEGARYQSLYRSHDLLVLLYAYYGYSGLYLTKYYVFDVYVRNMKNLYTVNADRAKQMSALIRDGEEAFGGTVVAAINGDYCSNSEVCRVCLRNARVLRAPKDVFCDVGVLYGDGTLHTYTPRAFDYEEALAKGAYQIWNFGPGLLDADGNVRMIHNENAYSRGILYENHPRTAFGCIEPGHYCFVVADGRQEDENGVMLHGCTLRSLAAQMKTLGCVSAYNMDGGDSSQAYMNGAFVRIDRTRDPQRVLSDVLCVGETEAQN